MDKEQCTNKTKPKGQHNDVIVSFRIWTEMNEWLRKNNFNSRRVFIEACKELGYKPTGEQK
jgi:hypothetical protein